MKISTSTRLSTSSWRWWSLGILVIGIIQPLFVMSLSAAPSEQIKVNPDSLKQAEKLITASGIEVQINQIPAALIQAGRQQAGPAASFIQPLMQSMQNVFVPDEMIDTLSNELVTRLDVPTMLDALKWYQSENGQTIVNAHKAMLKPDMMEKVAKAMTNPTPDISDQRQSLLEAIASSTQSTDIALETMVNIQAAFMTALSNMISPDNAQSFDQLRDAFGNSKQKMRGQFAEQLLLQQAVLLEPLPDSTLQEFLQFADSGSGKKFFSALNGALDETLQIYARRLPLAVKGGVSK
ncbi:hypothetical protein FT643_06350 [Ketobacter sp. MCCC 1A13808]|uniref:hypothetical protein n=1 Tax=Ketobacter sp. MCCC 1A13808 TaxID=2602738 RepID=UPI000F0E883D|nr:hypothetical protein [Ketobacter sp. MCCC 1A13808]MVF11763.1 hypothetical protein [Ketobacter sp. MCCC 1A13808]RLP55370.1 MAG: hypothetical protein D6160_06385 [Ketobacter sp.]